MKRETYLAFCAALLLAVACTEERTSISSFDAERTTIDAEACGGEYSIAIRSDREWTAVTDVPWVMVSPANGRGEVRCIVKIDSTLVNEARTTDIRFSAAGELLQTMAVNQAGYGRSIRPSKSDVEVAASATRQNRHIELDVSSNVEFTIATEYDGEEEWIDIDDYTLTLDRGARPRTTRIGINWKMNSEPKERVATLHLNAIDGEPLSEPTTIRLRQMAAPLIEDNRAGDSLTVVTIYEKMECWSENALSTTEGMHRWECVRLWEANDKGLPSPDAVGRVRDLDLSYFNTEEGIPSEIKHLKYLETLSIYGNVNTMLKSIELGEEVCTLDNLKALRIAAFGLVSLPHNFEDLGDTLEELDLNSNNFTSIPEVLTPENFPKLTVLNMASNRRSALSDLRNIAESESGIGLHIDMKRDESIRRLLLWENLEELTLSFNYIEGELPDFRVGEDGVRAYSADDLRERGDSLNWAVESALPRILPNAKALRLNLNYMTGRVPDWLLYHPRLLEWSAESLIYTQQDNGTDSAGNRVGFDNEPTSHEYYFEKYPLLRGRFEFNDEIEEE